MSSAISDLRRLLAGRRFRQLFAVRVTSQFADGVFQVALASYALFSPERQPDAGAIAIALAAVLLPFTVLGPFVGVFLDRWNRRQILIFSNVVRTAPVVAAAVVISTGSYDAVLVVLVITALSINRFLLADLSAALPRVVEADELVLANSLSPTCGTLAFICGLAVGSALDGFPSPWPAIRAWSFWPPSSISRRPPWQRASRCTSSVPTSPPGAPTFGESCAGWHPGLSPDYAICTRRRGRQCARSGRRAPVLLWPVDRRDDPAVPQLLQRPHRHRCRSRGIRECRPGLRHRVLPRSSADPPRHASNAHAYLDPRPAVSRRCSRGIPGDAVHPTLAAHRGAGARPVGAGRQDLR